jgi:hypothetical protein
MGLRDGGLGPEPMLGRYTVVAVAGGRRYKDKQLVFQTLDHILADRAPAPLLLVHGGAGGADYLAAVWAESREIPALTHPAQWNQTLPRAAAGPRRNQEMLTAWSVEHLVVFPGGRGTADCAQQAEAAGIPVTYVI